MPAKKGTKEEKLREIVFICMVSTDLQVRTAICKFGSGTVVQLPIKTRKKVFKAILASDCYHCIACFFLLFPAFIACRPNWLNKKLLELSYQKPVTNLT